MLGDKLSFAFSYVNALLLISNQFFAISYDQVETII